MHTYSLDRLVNPQPAKRTLPVTPRGRALRTIDWFLNGTPVAANHDEPRTGLAAGVRH